MSELQEQTIGRPELKADWFRNSYRCPDCGNQWDDEWSCMCNDRCPNCEAEIEPISSEDLSRPVTHDDYLGAARLIFGSEAATNSATAEEAKAYAEAMMEGGPSRFECDRMANHMMSAANPQTDPHTCEEL